jgi:transposase
MPSSRKPLAAKARRKAARRPSCRVRSYLVTSRNHGIRPIDAIHAALTRHPWLPAPVSA